MHMVFMTAPKWFEHDLCLEGELLVDTKLPGLGYLVILVTTGFVSYNKISMSSTNFA